MSLRVNAYLRYLWRSSNKHGVHSPFVYRWYEEVYKGGSKPEASVSIESYRKENLGDESLLPSSDPGKGSDRGSKRSIANSARWSASSPKQCAFLYRMVEWMECQRVLELGTSLGIATSYMSQSVGERLWTIEGDDLLHARAKDFILTVTDKVECVHGLFKDTLPKVLEEVRPVDMVFIDGHHDGDATMRYVEQILPFTHEHSVFILDDIHWSEDMEKAWHSLMKDERFSLSIDIFWSGLLFMHKGRAKEHFILR